VEHILQQVNMEEEFLESFYGREADISSEDEDEGESNDTRRAPPGWKLERSTKVKRFFYFNVESRLKYWQDESLPYGWAIEYSEGGHKKYVNMITGESTLNKPHRKNQISPDALAKQRGKSTSSMSHNGGRGSLGGGGSSNSSSSGDGGGAGTGSDSKQRQRSGSTGSVGSADVWKLVFSEKLNKGTTSMQEQKNNFGVWKIHQKVGHLNGMEKANDTSTYLQVKKPMNHQNLPQKNKKSKLRRKRVKLKMVKLQKMLEKQTIAITTP
jgi:hypothetical protein